MCDIYDDNPLQLELGTEIRVLELLSDVEDDPKADYEIVCRLHTISLGDGTPYVAVSYVWGSALDTEDILLDGSVFKVRRNLYRLLQKMVRRKLSAYFWVDAICVNQSNIRERNQQVGLMEQIYQKASMVVVWLNPQNATVDYAMVFLARIFDRGVGSEDFEHVKWALKQICYLEYWSRAWIVQEYTLAENLELWGNRCSISGDVLSYAAYDYIWWLKNLEENKGTTGNPESRIKIPWTSPAGKIISCRKQWRFSRSERQLVQQSHRKFTRPEGLPFDYVFSLIGEYGRQLQCADVRDRVYAMLSLLREEDSLKLAIAPDYSRSVYQLFFDICTKVCKEINEVEKFRSLLELAPDHRVVRFVHSNWPLRLKNNTYGSNELDMSIALLLPYNESSVHIPRLVSAPGVLIPRHLAAKVDLYASMPPLNSTHIRLLHVLPENNSDGSSHINCILRTVSSAERAMYVALSYAWGDETPNRPIRVNGHQFNVRKNLWMFLDQVRTSKYNKEIWIDAICINQEDLLEKTHQTRMMSQIFAHASTVMAWLGPDLEDVEISSIRTINDAYARLKAPSSSFLGRCNWAVDQITPVEESLKAADRVLDALQSVLSNQYWRRTWIIQEFILAKEVELWAGSLLLNAHVLSSMCEAFTTWPRIPPAVSGISDYQAEIMTLKSKSRKLRTCWAVDIVMQRDFRQGYHKTKRRWKLVRSPTLGKWHSLRHLLADSAASDCVDPRDRVYALLSLVTTEELEYFDIVPDYSKPGSQLFIDLACAFCMRHGLDTGWTAVQHLAEPLCSDGYIDLNKLYSSLQGLLEVGCKDRWQLLASRVIYEMSGKQACFEPEVRDGG